MVIDEMQASNALKAAFDKLLKPYRSTEPSEDISISRTIPSYPEEQITVTVTLPQSDTQHIAALAHSINEATAYDVKETLSGIEIRDPHQYQKPEGVIDALQRRLHDNAAKISIALEDYYDDLSAG